MQSALEISFVCAGGAAGTPRQVSSDKNSVSQIDGCLFRKAAGSVKRHSDIAILGKSGRDCQSGAETDPRIGVQEEPLGWRRIEAAAHAPAQLVRVAQRGERGSACAEAFDGQTRFLKRRLSLPVSTMSQ
jgi:hypothetical protein